MQQRYLFWALFGSKPSPCPCFLTESLSSLAHKPQDASDYSLNYMFVRKKKEEEGTSCRENLPVASTNFNRFRETNQAVTSSRNLWCSKRILLCTLILKIVQWHHKDSCRTIHFPGPHLHISTYNWWWDKSSEDLGMALAQPLSSHSLVPKSVNCLTHWFTHCANIDWANFT